MPVTPAEKSGGGPLPVRAAAGRVGQTGHVRKKWIVAAQRKHQKPRHRSISGHTARTAATLALASAASAGALEGTGQAEPRLTAAQVKAKVDKLYHEAEIATEQYNGVKERAKAAADRVDTLQDEAARRTERLNSARTELGSAAAAQYRTGAIAPSMRLALASDPDDYLDRAMLADRAGVRQAAAVRSVQGQLRELDRLHAEAGRKSDELGKHRAKLRKHKKDINAKLASAQRLLDRLTAAERRQVTDGLHGGSGDARASRGLPRDLARDLARGSVNAPNSRAAQAVSYAYDALGSPYVWGASGPNSFDCSGLTQAAYRSTGVSLPRTTYTQINAGRRVARSELAPGDLVFFYSGVSHVGLYVGNGQMIHAPNPNAPVRVAPVDSMPFSGATRVA
ncbi:NlpC/P60 family protein [Streptomyces sp. B-S-A8]|uniref:NlpC/P60 family protein n=1 Tax=Streptomyces solicavernae TaxID=3043614 RepID=A0ABT6RML8_9ACTN|nr:NlpC/P60 family protein [Streptomyces sp. B-S-A8]MDI3385681.1 NlpC/P60 family protein [Streptomyces sp. B-S-A8]